MGFDEDDLKVGKWVCVDGEGKWGILCLFLGSWKKILVEKVRGVLNDVYCVCFNENVSVFVFEFVYVNLQHELVGLQDHIKFILKTKDL